MLEEQRRREPVDPARVAEEIMAQTEFVTYHNRGASYEMFILKDGFLTEGAEAYIRKAVEAAYPSATSHEKEETIAHVRDRTLRERGDVEGKAEPFWGLQNGVVDWRTGEYFTFEAFKQAHPDVLLLHRLPVTYDPSKWPLRFLAWLREVQPNADSRRILLDHFAALLDKRRSRKRVCLLLWGPTNSRKTTFLNVERAFMGDANVSGIPLHQLCGDNRFAMAGVVGKSLNAPDELQEEMPLKYLGPFKRLTGGFTIWVEKKGIQGYEDLPWVKVHIATNKPPTMKNVEDMAFWDRWQVVEFDQALTHDEMDDGVLPMLTAPEELSGILNVLLGVVRRQASQGFTFPPVPEDSQNAWLGQAEPARTFLGAYVSAQPDGYVRKADLYAKWNAWRQQRGHVNISETRFNELVGEVFGAQAAVRRIMGKNAKVWVGIAVREANGNGQTALHENPATGSTGFDLTPASRGNSIKKGVRGQKAVVSVAEGLRALFGGGRP
jgi:P4 family phage/plasmid primase-like protien